ncbi:MAG: type VI secretion system baseplate subunit TssG [Candidatus Symbiothrix sp.]|nr:type VI secretion system baseplate subunit TssG [Candidatus Symbiothrix sp.]
MTKNKNKRTPNTIETDYRAELVAANWIEAGQDDSTIHIIRGKGDRRGVSKDIENIKKEYVDIGFDLVEYLSIYANRDGIYDSLPEGVFHQPPGTQRQKQTEDVLREMKERKEEEFFVRKYFQPFEMAFDKLRIRIRLYELRYNKPTLYNNLAGIFEEHWEILKFLTARQAFLFIKTIPLLEEIAQSLGRTAKAMEMILECPVRIQEGKRSRRPLTPSDATSREKWKLGLNTVPGNTAAADNPDLEITLGPAPVEKIKQLLPGKTNSPVLQNLIEMMIPFDRYFRIKYKTNDDEKKFRLSSNTHTACLGINTTLEKIRKP